MPQTFQKLSGFCSDCGSILPPLREKGGITCYSCSSAYSANDLEVIGQSRVKYTIHFNSRDSKKKTMKDPKDEEEAEEGPVVERKCPKCGNEKMSYATLQLRSADEGQTVFYTCTKCKFKETENS
ncbi:unnamed protein product [Acanthoscelides obtectus]|uniref:DNA-directed RNA polymerase subunit n=1 Tax=Acanthoscelides obtectus TaxID=200917 RepID=A0A9P0JZS8_ACAOB|nr:unnamed protein product [Acanthoscelides obtectus]CAK1631482.1 DNA-directed RNA polymerase I subunit RPA12 [Acanthoscelides obtectus]